jgi:hypothetical protein
VTHKVQAGQAGAWRVQLGRQVAPATCALPRIPKSSAKEDNMSNASSTELPARWERIRILASVASTVLIPVVIAVVTNGYTSAIKQNELGVRYVEIALSILRAPPSEQTSSLRKWAIEVVNTNSQVPLPAEALKELETQDVEKLLIDFSKISRNNRA